MLRDALELLWHVGVLVVAVQWALQGAELDTEAALLRVGSGRGGRQRYTERHLLRLLIVVLVAVGLGYHVVVKWLCYVHGGYCP